MRWTGTPARPRWGHHGPTGAAGVGSFRERCTAADLGGIGGMGTAPRAVGAIAAASGSARSRGARNVEGSVPSSDPSSAVADGAGSGSSTSAESVHHHGAGAGGADGLGVLQVGRSSGTVVKASAAAAPLDPLPVGRSGIGTSAAASSALGGSRVSAAGISTSSATAAVGTSARRRRCAGGTPATPPCAAPGAEPRAVR